ncbi:MAG: hypothetical protein WBL42_10735 [Methanoregula sp.]
MLWFGREGSYLKDWLNALKIAIDKSVEEMKLDPSTSLISEWINNAKFSCHPNPDSGS